MCEANAYLVKEGQEQLIMQSVDVAEPQENGAWRLIDIFGDQKIIRGSLKALNLVNHKIFFEE